MKNSIYKNLWSLCLLLGFTLSALIFTSCEDDGFEQKETGAPLSISNVYLEDANSNVPDRLVEFARLGQTIRLEGTGFLGVKKIYVNGYSVYFSTTMMTDNNLIFRISSSVPVLDAEEDVRNTIVLEKSESNSYKYIFEIRSAAPTITNISHTMPQAGELIRITGTALQEIKSVTFPGDVVATEGIVEDENGTWIDVIVPGGITESGSIMVVGANGGAYSPAYFNFKKGLLHNFDDVNNASWSNGNISDDLNAVIPSGGNLPKSQGIYRCANKDGAVIKAGDTQVDYTRYWINNSVWAGIVSASGIDLGSTSDQIAIQMDIYYEGVWNSGDIRFVIKDGLGASRFCLMYAPWVSASNLFATEGGTRVAVENPGCWHTITLPFTQHTDFDDLDLAGILAEVATASYAQGGPWFENGDVAGVKSEDSNLNVYFDNMRIVPLTGPTYSDFNDDEE